MLFFFRVSVCALISWSFIMRLINWIDILKSIFFFLFFFYQGFLSRTLTTHRTAEEEKGPSYSTLPLPPAQEHSDIYLQLCVWDDYHMLMLVIYITNICKFVGMPINRPANTSKSNCRSSSISFSPVYS